MPSIKGIEVKNFVNLKGLEECGLQADMFLNGKQIGVFIDQGHGGPASVEFFRKEDEECVMKLLFEYAKEHPVEDLVAFYRLREDLFVKEVDRIQTYFPYLEGEITIEAVSGFNMEYLVCELISLTNLETIFMEDILKEGCRAMSLSDDAVTGYPEDWSDERIREASKGERLFMSLQDFYID